MLTNSPPTLQPTRHCDTLANTLHNRILLSTYCKMHIINEHIVVLKQNREYVYLYLLHCITSTADGCIHNKYLALTRRPKWAYAVPDGVLQPTVRRAVACFFKSLHTHTHMVNQRSGQLAVVGCLVTRGWYSALMRLQQQSVTSSIISGPRRCSAFIDQLRPTNTRASSDDSSFLSCVCVCVCVCLCVWCGFTACL